MFSVRVAYSIPAHRCVTVLFRSQDLEVTGVCLLENVPDQLGQVRVLADRVGFIKRTHYGEEFSVRAKADAANVAYTSGYLQLHTDLPYYEYKPGVCGCTANLLAFSVSQPNLGLLISGEYITLLRAIQWPRRGQPSRRRFPCRRVVATVSQPSLSNSG